MSDEGEEVQLVMDDCREAMQKSVDSLESDLVKVRTGRANPALLEGVQVDYYGTPTPLKKLATINAPEPRLLVIQAFDPQAIPAIERGILKAELGFSPVSDGKLVRVPIPELTEERRREYVKLVKKAAEEHKVGVRNARRDAIAMLKDLQKDGDLAEDASHAAQKRVQDLTDEYVAQIDKRVTAKEEEILRV